MPKGNADLKAAHSVAPQSITADADGTSVKGAAIDCRGFDEAQVVLHHGAVADGATLSAKVQESATTTDGDFTDITDAAFADVAGGATVLSGIYQGRLNLVGRKRYIRVVTTLTGNTLAGLVAASVVLAQANQRPVAPVNTLAFSI